MNEGRRRTYWVLYPLWFGVCAALFVLLRNAEDPSRPTGRMTPQEAATAALEHLRGFDEERFGDYHVIDAAIYRDVARNEKIWIVLCDATPRTALRRAVVVDLDSNTGHVLRVRRPEGVEVEEFPVP